jgi:hypothetical protein
MELLHFSYIINKSKDLKYNKKHYKIQNLVLFIYFNIYFLTISYINIKMLGKEFLYT